MTRHRNLRRLAASCVLVPLLALGACGGDDEMDSAGAGDTEKQAAGTEETKASASATGDAVAIVDFNYDPADLKVDAGTTVTFTNEDGFAHTVTAKDKSFDSGNLDKGATFEHTFDEAGTYDYICAIHNSMVGSVTVS